MTSSESVALANLERIGKLKAEAPDARERAGLLRSATVRLQDARQPILSLEVDSTLPTMPRMPQRCLPCVHTATAVKTVIWSSNVSSTHWDLVRSSGVCSIKRKRNAISPNMRAILMSRQASWMNSSSKPLS